MTEAQRKMVNMRERRDRALDELTVYIRYRMGDPRFSGEVTIRFHEGQARKDKVKLSHID
ncbi:MAG: hypothetical protein KAU50_05245 [Candidatus Marinimicrobia bacterium]|nr:hypothetical protein [Candidatus Neomarinimicrobiota bacterium]